MNTAPTNLQLESSYGQILRMAFPISMAILVPQLNFVINNIFLGWYDSSGQALAAAGITGVYYLTFSAIGYGLNNGLQSLISRKAGADQPAEIGKLFNQGLILALVMALAGILFTYLFAPYIFQKTLSQPAIFESSIRFLKIRIWGLPLLYWYQMRNALLVGTNQSRLLFWATAVEALCNVWFDYLLIFGRWGLPEMGFEGAAVASILAEGAGVLAIFILLKVHQLDKQFHLNFQLQWKSAYIRPIFKFSYPLMVQQALSIASWEYFFIMIEHYGSVQLQVSNVMRNVFGLFGSASWAFSTTANGLISNLYGQQKPELIWPAIWKIATMSAFTVGSLLALLNIFPTYFLALFGQGIEFQVVGLPTLRVVSIAIVLMSISGILLQSVIALGRSKLSLAIETAALFVYCGYVWLVLRYHHYPLFIGWMSEWVYWICLAIPCFIFLKYGAWKKELAQTLSN